MYWVIYCRYSLDIYDCLFWFIDSFIDSFIARKTIESLRNRFTVDFVTSEEKLKKLAAQLSFKQFNNFHENVAAVERARGELTLNLPIYVGFAILDLSKTLMYDFDYNYIKQTNPHSMLLFTKTDCLTYQIPMDNVHENVYADMHLFNFSGNERKPILWWWKQKSNW